MPLPYRPRERRTLENLLAGLGGGLDPAFALGMFQDTQQGALDRLATQRAKTQQRMATRQAVLPEMSSFATETAMAGLPPDVAQTAFSGYGPGIQGSLDDLLGSLYPGGATQSPYSQGTAGLDPDDQGALWADAIEALQTGASPSATVEGLRVTYGPLLDGHEAEVEALVQRALATLGDQAPANARMAERAEGGGEGFPWLGAGVAGGLGALAAKKFLPGLLSRSPRPGTGLDQLASGGLARPGGTVGPARTSTVTAGPAGFGPSSPRPALGGRAPLELPAAGGTRPNAGPIQMPGRGWGSEPAFTQQASTGGLAQAGRAPLMPRSTQGLYGALPIALEGFQEMQRSADAQVGDPNLPEPVDQYLRSLGDRIYELVDFDTPTPGWSRQGHITWGGVRYTFDPLDYAPIAGGPAFAF